MSDAVPGAPTGPPEPQSGPDAFTREGPPRARAPTSPVLAVDGFEGPLDWLLEMVRACKIDLARLSILALVEAFAGAMDAALARTPEAPAPDLARWADWTVMAAHLTELRARLLLPADAPEARTAQAEAAALRLQWIRRTETAAAANWLERRPQLGFAVFARGRPETVRAARAAGQGEGRDDLGDLGDLGDDLGGLGTDGPPGMQDDDWPVAGGDLTDLLRACLVALRLPPGAAAGQPWRHPFWSISDAAARITRLIDGLPEGAALAALLPAIAGASANRDLRCRAALSATFAAGLELTRSGTLTLEQDMPWQPIHVRRRDGAATKMQPLI